MKLITLVQLTDSGEEEESIIAKLLTVSGTRMHSKVKSGVGGLMWKEDILSRISYALFGCSR